MKAVFCSARSVAVRASTTTSAPAQPRSLVIDISKRKLVDSYGGRAVRNVDNQIYEIVYEPATDSVRVLNKAARVEYATEVGKDNRIAILLDQTTELPGGLPSFPQLQSLLKASSPGAEALNGRLAMLGFVGIVATELATGRSLPAQLATTSGAAHAAALGLAVMAASLAPLLSGRVRPEQAFPSENDSYASTQLPYFWTALAEIINGRVAMVGLAGLLVNELVRGAPLF